MGNILNEFNKDINVLQNGKKTIGVLIGTMASTFHDEILRGVHDEAVERGYNIISFIGGPLNSPTSIAKIRDKVFELVDINILDGVIAPFGSLTRYVDGEQAYQFISRYCDVPIVNIEGHYEGVTNINSNISAGLSELMDHFILEHGYKKIALFRGPKNHPASEVRLEIYKKNLQKHGIEIDEELIVSGVLQRERACDFVEELFDNRNKKCDAIITINDNLALGVIDCLDERNIKVPNDIAVSGMMGISMGLFSKPSLTTIKQHVYEIGRKGVVAIVDQIEGGKRKEEILVPTKVILRESCGCNIHESISGPIKETYNIKENILNEEFFRGYLFGEIKEKCSSILEESSIGNCEDELDKLLDTYYNAMFKNQQYEFLDYATGMYEDRIRLGNVIPWMSILHILKLQLIQLLEDKREDEDLYTFLCQLSELQDLLWARDSSYKDFEIDFYLNFFRQISATLNASFDLKAVRKNISKILDLNDCYISAFEENNSSYVTNMLAIRDKDIVDLDDDQQFFKAKHLIPPSAGRYNERYTFMVFPLSFRDDFMGFAVLNLSSRRGTAYENAQAIISAALKNELQITKLKRQEERITKLAYYDNLTGMLNRTGFESLIDELVKGVGNTNSGFGIMFLDIDRFKNINDSMGHAAGDLLLKKVSQLLQSCVSGKDVIARFGGDEFIVIISNPNNEKEVTDIADRILKRLVAFPININDNHLFITASIGVVMVPRDGINVISILKNADTAMYRAKKNGRNRYAIYNKQIEEKNENRIKEEEILYRAIKRGEFILEYQPQIQCDTKEIIAVEALVRIQSKKYGRIAPNNFIPLAEELGLIGHIDEWALKTALKQLSKWNEKGYTNIKMSVNISTHQLRNHQLIDRYSEIIDKYQVNPSSITLEMTENSLIENEDIANNILDEFAKKGIAITLDDFGTGYSSLYCIQTYPINEIKIDRSFVDNILATSKNKAIINAIIQMSKDLNLNIVAEGVESKEQYEMIKALGCNIVQGYYFSRLQSAEVIEAMLKKGYVE